VFLASDLAREVLLALTGPRNYDDAAPDYSRSARSREAGRQRLAGRTREDGRSQHPLCEAAFYGLFQRPVRSGFIEWNFQTAETRGRLACR
jgi:hypothetical protein